MVAQLSNHAFPRASLSPELDPDDSDDVTLALETARALEAKGDIPEAVRWLRRATEAAEKDGNDLRVVTLARAAADLSSTAGSPERGSIEPPTPRPAGWALSSSHPADGDRGADTSAGSADGSPPTARALPRARVSPPPLPPSALSPPPARVSSAPPIAPRAAVPPPEPALLVTSSPPDEPVADRPPIRVSVKHSALDTGLFVVRQLEAGKPLPPGTTEALLVFQRK